MTDIHIHRHTTTTPQPSATTTTTPAPITTTTAAPITTFTATANSPYRNLGNTTRDAFKEKMVRTVSGPVPFAKDLDAMYDELAAGGVTRLAVPMSWMECKNSTWPSCGVPQWCRNPWSVTGQGDAGSSGRWAAYSSYRVAAQTWADLVVNGSPYRSARSIAEFIHVYAPASDNNDEAQYVQVIVDGVNALPLIGGTTPTPKPKPVTEADVLKLIAGPTAYVGFGFNQPNMSCPPSGSDPCHFYAYGVNRGTSADYMHTGDDVIIPRGTTVHTPLAGRVVCVGVQGEVVWDEGCGSFTDTSGGVGNVTVLTDAGVKIVFGHCAKSLVSYNQRVTAGQPVALSGTNRSDHLHLDVTVKRNGSYWLVDPLPAIVAALQGASLPEGMADPVDIAQPDDQPPYVTVKALRPTPVLQRGNPKSPKILPDLAVGATFFAQHQVLGTDGKWYFVGRLQGRVLVDDCEIVEAVLA